MALVAGIDPGVSGAVAWLSAGHLIEVLDLPMAELKVGKTMRKRLIPSVLAEMLSIEGRLPDHVYLEEVATRPGEGAVGAFSFGRAFGQIEGVLAALDIPYSLVRPNAWKKKLRLPADKGSTRTRACQLWPGAAERFKLVKNDGRADACMIGLYGGMIGSGL
jgi:crossover junction endodeoxyribonuclease RuvC